MMQQDELRTQNQEALEEPTASPEGVPSGDAPQQSDDAGLASRLEELRQKYERDLSQLRSSLDRRYSQKEQSWDQEKQQLLTRLDDVITSSMSEQDRGAYELERLKQQRSEYERQIAQARQEAEEVKSMHEYAKYFNELGVPYDKLNFDSPQDMMQSAWSGLKETMNEQKRQMEELREQMKKVQQPTNEPPKKTTPQGKTAPQTFTGKGQPPAPADAFRSIQKALSEQYGRDVSDEEVFRQIEGGRIDINSLLRAQAGE
jgi:DNA repair exonuclease SbcCD ATPase subunit